MKRRTFLRGLGAAFLAANLWLMPSRPEEPEWVDGGEGSIYGIQVTEPEDVISVDPAHGLDASVFVSKDGMWLLQGNQPPRRMSKALTQYREKPS